jgi:starch synthase
MTKGKFLNILFITSEAVPFAKTGGLGDVGGILPKVLARSNNVSLFIPGYLTDSIHELQTTMEDAFDVSIGRNVFPASIKKAVISPRFSVFFVSNEHFFAREFLYGDSSGDYADNFTRFLFFQKAALEFVFKKGLHFDIVHCNDWQTALFPLFLKLEPYSSFFRKSKTLFSIHNLGYQGIFPASSFTETQLPEYLFSPEYLEFYGNLNCMKAGIVFSDSLVTVSPTYAKEILSPDMGFGLEGLLNKFSFKLSGILNGVDYNQWNPETDAFIDHGYSVASLEEKTVNKQGLYAELGIIRNIRSPLMILISRISVQKGVELLLNLLPVLLEEDLHFIFLGVGDGFWTEKLKKMAASFPDRMTFLNCFDEKLAHRLEAAADVLFMPSVYEPCGLNQIYSMKYGTVPLVRATGGLEDSVEEFDLNTHKGTGFKFKSNNIAEVMAVIKRVLRIFSNRALWRKIQKNGMAMDFSWEKTVSNYLDLYNNILGEDTHHG